VWIIGRDETQRKFSISIPPAPSCARISLDGATRAALERALDEPIGRKGSTQQTTDRRLRPHLARLARRLLPDVPVAHQRGVVRAACRGACRDRRAPGESIPGHSDIRRMPRLRFTGRCDRTKRSTKAPTARGSDGRARRDQPGGWRAVTDPGGSTRGQPVGNGADTRRWAADRRQRRSRRLPRSRSPRRRRRRRRPGVPEGRADGRALLCERHSGQSVAVPE
jgi:hypothetical protein